MVIKRVIALYRRYENHISSVSLFGGFVFDILTLRKADSFWENFWIIIHLLVVAGVILLLNRSRKDVSTKDNELDFWLLNLLQFTFGGLLSAFLILYFRSATLAVSWPFIIILALAFLANERLKRHYARLVYQVSFFFLALLLFSIFFLPVLVGMINAFVFLLSGGVSIVILGLFLHLLEKISRDKLLDDRRLLRGSVLSIFLLINLLYFTNIIPPIPLSLKEGGIYHFVDREPSGYLLRTERSSWLDYFRLEQKIKIMPGDDLYAYTAIYSPAKFNLEIVHQWEFYDKGRGYWVDISRVPLRISGGRDNGFRTFSTAEVTPGKWRVSVQTKEGLTLGRIGFDIEYVSTPPELVTEIH